jgi:hypothetical protein
MTTTTTSFRAAAAKRRRLHHTPKARDLYVRPSGKEFEGWLFPPDIKLQDILCDVESCFPAREHRGIRALP